MATSYTSGSIWDSVGGGRQIYATCSQTKGSSSENKSTIILCPICAVFYSRLFRRVLHLKFVYAEFAEN